MSEAVAESKLDAGRQALQRHEWRLAYDLLNEADREKRLDGPALEELGDAAWWSGKLDAQLAALERAYGLYAAENNNDRAAVTAMHVAWVYFTKSQPAIGQGWFARAHRLLEDTPESPAHAELAVRQAGNLIARGDGEGALRLAERGVELARKFGDRQTWALATHVLGQAHLQVGHVDEGMALIDEATAAAVGGELPPFLTGLVYCWTISACRDIADFSRASEWTEAANRWCERQSIEGFPGICRIHRAELLRLRGALEQAAHQAMDAASELPGYSPRMAGMAFAEVGMVRLRTGDVAGAEEALLQARDLGDPAQPGLGLVQLLKGDVAAAASSVGAELEASLPRFDRLRILPAAVEIFIAAGQLDRAREAVAELQDATAVFQSAAHRAAAVQARAALGLAEGSPREAAADARKAVRLWQEIDAPYEAASARTLLGLALVAIGDAGAEFELKSAQVTFKRLGAPIDLERVTRILERGAAAPSSEQRTFLFSDIVKSTNLIEAIGDEAWVEVVRWHDDALRGCFRKHHGEEISHTGDGFFVVFASPREAIDCAVSIQRDLAAHRRDHGFAPRVRIGVHAAEGTRSQGIYRGKGVHEAARIAALAGPDEILVSEPVAAEVNGLTLKDKRAVELKGISEPVEVAALEWR